MRFVVVPLFRLPFALVSHIPQVVSFLPCHRLRIMSGDLRRPPLAEIIIRMVSHRLGLLWGFRTGQPVAEMVLSSEDCTPVTAAVEVVAELLFP